MKVKKDSIKKKKNKIESVANTGIKKIKKKKVQKVQNNSEVAEAVKQEFAEQKDTDKRIPLRQLTWNTYLKVFYDTEKLNKKQRQIMEFCTNKRLTPPRRKQKFLNFIRNCYPNQKDVADELCNELFDMLLKKYDEYKAGTYGVKKEAQSSDTTKATPTKLSKNKKKKLNRPTSNKSGSPSLVKTPNNDEKWEKIKLKKRKHQKQVKVKSENDNDDMETNE